MEDPFNYWDANTLLSDKHPHKLKTIIRVRAVRILYQATINRISAFRNSSAGPAAINSQTIDSHINQLIRFVNQE